MEPREASIGAVAKVKQAGKVYCGSIVAVGTKAEIEKKWKELEGGDDSDKATKEVDKGCMHAEHNSVRVYVHAYCTCMCIML